MTEPRGTASQSVRYLVQYIQGYPPARTSGVYGEPVRLTESSDYLPSGAATVPCPDKIVRIINTSRVTH